MNGNCAKQSPPPTRSGLEKLFYLAAIVDSTGEAIVSQNLDGIITTWNAGASNSSDIRRRKPLEVPSSLIIPESLQSFRMEIFDNLRRGKPIEPFETKRVRKDGAEMDVSSGHFPH